MIVYGMVDRINLIVAYVYGTTLTVQIEIFQILFDINVGIGQSIPLVIDGVLILLSKQLDIRHQAFVEFTSKQTKKTHLTIPEFGAVLGHEAGTRLLKGKVVGNLLKNSHILRFYLAMYMIFRFDYNVGHSLHNAIGELGPLDAIFNIPGTTIYTL